MARGFWELVIVIYVRSSRVACYSRDLGDAFEHSWVLSWVDELLAESLYSGFRGG